MTWAKIHEAGPRIGFALFFLAVGALGDGIFVQSGKVNFLKSRSNELYSIQPAEPELSRAAVSQPPPKCPTPGYRGEPVRH